MTVLTLIPPDYLAFMEQEIQLVSSTGEQVTGLICELSDRHITDYNDIWRPMLIALNQPDQNWD